jgi:uncharacterized cupin superfamily protein
MQATVADGIFIWSVWQPDRNLFFNSFFVVDGGGNLAIDPLPLSEEDLAEIERRGGLAWVAVTNRDHERDARAIAKRFGAKIAASEADAALLSGPVDRRLNDGEELAGARVIALEGLKTAGEIALLFRKQRTVVVGDALWGDPAGSVRLMPDGKLTDPARAALSLRRLCISRPAHLLVGDGACIFGDAMRVIWDCLERRTDVYANKINIDEGVWYHDGPSTPGLYQGSWLDVDPLIGAEKLGYLVARLPPGKAFCPVHWHAAEEELYYVLEGTPTLVTPRGNWRLRKGDLISFPARAAGAHKLLNDGETPCEVLMIANTDPDDVCYYPDSHKLLVEKSRVLVRDNPILEYFDGE